MVTGTYDTNADQGVFVDGYSEAVVEVVVSDEAGYPLDDAYFHSESIAGPFTFTVPDGSVNVRVRFESKDTDGQGRHVEYQIDGPVDHDVDMGFIELR